MSLIHSHSTRYSLFNQLIEMSERRAGGREWRESAVKLERGRKGKRRGRRVGEGPPRETGRQTERETRSGGVKSGELTTGGGDGSIGVRSGNGAGAPTGWSAALHRLGAALKLLIRERLPARGVRG